MYREEMPHSTVQFSISSSRRNKLLFGAAILIVWLSFVFEIDAQYRFDSWTTDNGLPQISVNSIVQTHEGIFNAALDLGVKGFVLKDSALTEIIDCIEAVRRGQNCISPSLSTYLINRRHRTDALAEEKTGLKSMTPSERNIFKMIANGKTSREIAAMLFISICTVDRHRANISQKLNLRGTNALVKFAITHKSEI